MCGINAGKDAEKSVKMVLQSLRQKQKHQTFHSSYPNKRRQVQIWGDILERPNLEEDSLNSSPNLFFVDFLDSNIYQCVFGEVNSGRKV